MAPVKPTHARWDVAALNSSSACRVYFHALAVGPHFNKLGSVDYLPLCSIEPSSVTPRCIEVDPHQIFKELQPALDNSDGDLALVPCHHQYYSIAVSNDQAAEATTTQVVTLTVAKLFTRFARVPFPQVSDPMRLPLLPRCVLPAVSLLR